MGRRSMFIVAVVAALLMIPAQVMAAPGGFTTYRKQGRLIRPLAVILVAGTVPGILLGTVLRLRHLQDAGSFKPIAGGVLGLLALALVFYGLYALKDPVSRLSGLYESAFDVLALTVSESFLIIAIGIGLGLVGSWIAATRHMRRIEPR